MCRNQLRTMLTQSRDYAYIYLPFGIAFAFVCNDVAFVR